MTSMYNLDTNIPKMYSRTKAEVTRSRLSSVRARTVQTDRCDRRYFYAKFAGGRTRKSPAVEDLLSLVNHRKSYIVVAAAAAAVGAVTDAGDVRDVRVEENLQMRLGCEVVEVIQQVVAIGKHPSRVGTEALCRPLVVHVGDQRVPVVSEVELDVRSARVTLVDADQLVVAWIAFEEAAYPH